MFTKAKAALTYANVMATLALFLALGGGAYAAVNLPKNSVGSRQIKKNAVSSSKIKKNAVTSSRVKNGSLLVGDFKAGQIPAGPQGVKGDLGPQGVAGAIGATGAAGPTGPTGPSEAFNATAASGPADIGLSPTFTTVLSFTLPPGSYELSSEVVAANQSTTTDADVRCTLFSQTDPQMTATSVVHVPAGSSAAIPLQGVQDIADSSSFQSLQCRKSANVTIKIGEDPEFTAIMVGTIAAP
jgi:hypothetical protein